MTVLKGKHPYVMGIYNNGEEAFELKHGHKYHEQEEDNPGSPFITDGEVC